MIKELTLYLPNGKKETYEVGREVAGENIEEIVVEKNRAIIFFKNEVKVISGIPFEYTAPKAWIF
jgi:hypothetical protein